MKSYYNFYNILKLYKSIKSTRVKAIGLIASSILGFRHLSLRIDPALSCNLFCQMCYFSDSEKRKSLKGQLNTEQLNQIAKIFYPKAFQLVLGCGAEPTINRDFMQAIRLAKQYKIPNISIVTNGLLLRDSHIKEMIELEMDEIILSAHGLAKPNYEKFMVNGHFEKFVELLAKFSKYKNELGASKPQIRINYTVNEDNIEDLYSFKEFATLYQFDTIQVRPIMDIGGKYKKLLPLNLKDKYNNILDEIKNTCHQKNIKLLANRIDFSYMEKNKDAYLIDSVYTYLSPNTESELGIDFNKSSITQYKKSIKWYKSILLGIIKKRDGSKNADRFLKYDIE
ncbi:radical SAM protein [Carboxylicivirga linearis]|uniref:Radical SAM protein n=1 Tax=Carboxylicivirga linearis TaxID=1628157 RepID=A0ABS5K0X3_9BACT|nr:radical SAM protein [Carboxylicivirga linearis]MBS2100768.1 radical SAM protein [Carboxylicivirga linearis]